MTEDGEVSGFLTGSVSPPVTMFNGVEQPVRTTVPLMAVKKICEHC